MKGIHFLNELHAVYQYGLVDSLMSAAFVGCNITAQQFVQRNNLILQYTRND